MRYLSFFHYFILSFFLSFFTFSSFQQGGIFQVSLSLSPSPFRQGGRLPRHGVPACRHFIYPWWLVLMILMFEDLLAMVEIRSLDLRHLLVSSESAVKRMNGGSFFFLTMDPNESFNIQTMCLLLWFKEASI
jgi:hypothetical protein